MFPRFADPHCFELREDNQVIGTYLLNRESLIVNGQPRTGWYRSMLTSATHARGTGVGRQIVAAAHQWLARPADDPLPPLTYGCIATSNAPARRLLQDAGAIELAGVATALEYQQWHRRTPEHLTVTEGFTQTLARAWTARFDDAAIAPADPAAGQWVSISDPAGRFLACRHHVSVLDLTPLGGFVGLIGERLMSRVAALRRRFDPGRFRYVSVTSRLASPGGDALWPALRNLLMRRYGTHYVNVLSPATGDADLVVSVTGLAPGTGPGEVAIAPPDL